jgi:hypothetical protein
MTLTTSCRLPDQRYIDRVRSKLRPFAGPLSTPCWAYTGGHDVAGYARTTIPGSGQWRVHALLWRSAGGVYRDGWCLDHLCHNPGCCNPDHLELVPRGLNAARGLVKLTAEQRRSVIESSETAAVLAARYRVSKRTIFRIRRGTGRFNRELTAPSLCNRCTPMTHMSYPRTCVSSNSYGKSQSDP